MSIREDASKIYSRFKQIEYRDGFKRAEKVEPSYVATRRNLLQTKRNRNW